MPEKYVATFRVVFEAEGEIQSRVIGEHLTEALANVLDEDEDGDTVDMTQLIAFGPPLTATEAANSLRKARNVLLRTKMKDAYDVASVLDQMAHVLEHRDEEMAGNVPVSYDFGHFVDIAGRVWAGEMPID